MNKRRKNKTKISVIGLERGGFEALDRIVNNVDGIDIKGFQFNNYNKLCKDYVIKSIKNNENYDNIVKNADVCIVICKDKNDGLDNKKILKNFVNILKHAKKEGALTIGVFVPSYNKYAFEKKDLGKITNENVNKVADMTLVIPESKYINKSYDNCIKCENEEILNFVKTIKDLFTGTGLINISLDDYKKILRGSENSYIEVCESSGDNKELKAAKHILKSFKKYNDLNKVKSVFICLSSKDVSFNNTNIVCEYIKKSFNEETNCIYLIVQDNSLINKVQLSVIINE